MKYVRRSLPGDICIVSSTSCYTQDGMVMQGEIPKDLRGTLLRNGPGNFDVAPGLKIQHPFDGDGVITSYSFNEGSEVVLRRKFVRTQAQREELTAGCPQHSLLPVDADGCRVSPGLLLLHFNKFLSYKRPSQLHLVSMLMYLHVYLQPHSPAKTRRYRRCRMPDAQHLPLKMHVTDVILKGAIVCREAAVQGAVHSGGPQWQVGLAIPPQDAQVCERARAGVGWKGSSAL